MGRPFVNSPVRHWTFLRRCEQAGGIIKNAHALLMDLQISKESRRMKSSVATTNVFRILASQVQRIHRDLPVDLRLAAKMLIVEL